MDMANKKYSYIREIEIRFKKKRVKGKAIEEKIVNADKLLDYFLICRMRLKKK